MLLVELKLTKQSKGESMPEPGLPESFNVLMHELKGLGLDIREE
jgi:DNA-directed RNA polymerase subunit beta